jgi:hypothetical protein
MDVRRARQIRRLICQMPRQRERVPARERLAERSGLYHSLVGKLLVRGRNNAQTRRSFIPPGHPWRPRGKRLPVPRALGAITLCRLLLQPRLNDLSLMPLHADAALQLLLQKRILGNEPRRQTSFANFLDIQPLPGC